ncbi:MULTISPECIES: DUF1801 domain-containing protein [Flavobacteriaceae]|uniref:DUF1801 domain-containing protein n=2 Tax=Flavobacteriaceae TaxID=49546 RepID=A0A4Y8ATC0_9FLAO|nr:MULTISPECIES: DUF1801 domain-containing protein [Flavobacteriaceae]TEW75141.1 DUF1801 domain-containing protein [Gramella jeungdoensis]GGK41258.1 hypothetical protein GCM10007963_06590 [Lutibacter litoralis]
MNPIDQYFYNQTEPYQSIMLYLRSLILKVVPRIEEKYSYKIPFFCIDKKPVLYLNVLKGTDYVDVAIVHGIILEEKYPQLKNYNNRKQVRSLQVKSLEYFDELMFSQLLKDAVASVENSKRAWFV